MIFYYRQGNKTVAFISPYSTGAAYCIPWPDGSMTLTMPLPKEARP